MAESPPLADRFPPGLGTVVVSLAAGIAALAGSYGAVGFTTSFVVSPVERTLSLHMPGAVITFAITVLGDLGQKLNLLTAAAIVVALYALLVGLSVGIGRQLDSRLVPVVGSLVTVWVVTATLTVRPVAALAPAAAAGAVVLATDLSRTGERIAGETDPNGRRRVLAGLGTAAGASALGVALGEERSSTSVMGVNQDIYGDVDAPTYDVDDQLATADEASFSVDGIEPLVSEDFYNVDISSIDPSPSAADWSLSITGEVDEEVEVTYSDVREMEYEHRFVTLRCVGEGLNGHKTDTALWTGVPIRPLLERASPNSDCECVMLRAKDGFYEEFPLEALEGGLLAIGMNGDPLPRAHGAPARALVPGHWGEVNVKWLTEIELLARERKGYWEKKGWQGTGPVNTVAKLHGRGRTDDGRLVVGGHAYAGTRGVQRVDVSIDGGDTWTEADLTDPLPGASGPARDDSPERAEDAWRQWKHEYDSPGGSHEVVVRAVDRNGKLQTREESGPVPSGATGWVSRTIDPSDL
jgi:DMSO/TMAO reductase YedYZ molybdopterin-dependent catalytic subunit